MIANAIRSVLENFPLWMLGLGLLLGIVHARRVRPAEAPGALARETIFWAIGITGSWAFVFHVFFAPMTSARIGWQPSGFETEVGFANLAFGVMGLIARFRSIDFCWATVAGTSIFLLGAAANHIVGILGAGNFAPGNAGTILWSDVLIPIITIVLTARANRERRM